MAKTGNVLFRRQPILRQVAFRDFAWPMLGLVPLNTAVALCLTLLAYPLYGQQESNDLPRLSKQEFSNPGREYRPIDCWWWDAGYLDQEKMRWQLEDMHAKGIGGTWLYPRFGATQLESSEPGFWTDGWWEYLKFNLHEHQRLGMVQWANDWLGRLDKNYFQNQLIKERDQNPRLTGHRLVAHQKASQREQTVVIEVPKTQTILSAAAYRRIPGKNDAVDGDTRIDLMKSITGHKLIWKAADPNWLVIVVATEPATLNYLESYVAKRWIEIFFDKYRQHLGGLLGRALTAYGPDERFVLNGSILYTEGLRERFTREKGYDPLPDLGALFVDMGPRTPKVRCEYYDVMVSLLEENLYAPIADWLHEHGMKQATIATWGRENMLGQTTNYGDFFRMMRHFDMPGNEDSAESGAGAFIDTKLSSSIAHLNGKSRVIVCAYWGMGWGFTQEQNVARTNVNYAWGINLFNTHGVLYSFLAGRNEFVPPEVHFYQPYWKTWRAFTDYVARLSYVLSQGDHRADVALLYPLSTLHAHWRGGSKFDAPAQEAQRTTFTLAKAIHSRGIDFNFIDESNLASAEIDKGLLKPARLEFSVVVLPSITTIRTDVAQQLQKFVASGGTLVVLGDVPTASPELGRDDPQLRKIWNELFGDLREKSQQTVERKNEAGGRAILVRSSEADVASAISAAITPDVQTSSSDVIHAHRKVGEQDVYFFVNAQPEERDIDVTVRCSGVPEIWDARTGEIKPLHRFQRLPDGTRLRLKMSPHEGILVVFKPAGDRPQVVEDNLASIEDVRPDGNGFEVVGSARTVAPLSARLISGGRVYSGHSKGVEPEIQRLDGLWECEVSPTMDNRWGDFRYPASKELIGPEVFKMKYRPELPDSDKHPDWYSVDLSEDDWKDIQCTYGPHWNVLGPLDEKVDSGELRNKIVGEANAVDDPLDVGGHVETWRPYSYSWQFGADRMDVHQSGGDGLGVVSPDFIVFDRLPNKSAVFYLTTRIHAKRATNVFLHLGREGDPLVRQAWVNGDLVVNVTGKEDKSAGAVALREGWNQVTLRLLAPPAGKRGGRKVYYVPGIQPIPSPDKRIATFAVFLPTAELPERERFMPLLPWYEAASEFTHDYRPASEEPVGWYRFTAPPGARKAKLNLLADSVQAWVNGTKAKVVDGVLQFPSEKQPSQSSQVTLRVKHARGFYEGAAFRAPIAFECARGAIPLGDWSAFGLSHYSGGLVYIRKIHLTSEQLANRIVLDLGNVRTSAEVFVNGQSLGVRLARPFLYDLDQFVKPGENEIRIEVLNTLANYMSTQPTQYVFKGQTVSGLLGPAELRLLPRIRLHCVPESTGP